MELFQRQQIRDLLGEDISDNMAHVNWDRVNTVIEQVLERRQLELASQSRRFWHYFGVVYIFQMIPLPTFQYLQYWRDHKNYFRRYFVSYVNRITISIARYARIFTEILFFFIYFHNLARYLFSFADAVTFSDSFLRDCFTFLAGRSELLIARHTEIVRHDGNILYFAENDNVGIMEFIVVSFYNWLARNLVTSCTKGANGPLCYIPENSLIFRFLHVIQLNFPWLSEYMLRLITLMIYNVYAVIGWLVCFNVLIFFTVKLLRRIIKFRPFFANLYTMVKRSIGII